MTVDGTVTPAEAGRVVLDVAGLTVMLSFDTGLERLAMEISVLWSHLRVPVGQHAPDIELSYIAEGAHVVAGATTICMRPTAAYTISGNITRAVIQHLLGRQLLLHAGTVEVPGLGVVSVVGPSGAGKSTATLRLGRGGTYLTDELTIVDPHSFEITGYPKPVSRASPAARGKIDVSLDKLGLVPGSSAPAPRLIVLLDRIRDCEIRPDDSEGVERVPLSAALPELISQSSSLWKVPEGLAALASLVISAGGALRVRYREAADLSRLLAEPGTPLLEQWESISGQAPVVGLAPGMFIVAPFSQALAVADGVVILGPSRAGFLPGLAGLAWDILRTHDGLRLDDLEAQIAAEIGPHEKSSGLVRSTVENLVRAGWALSA